MPSTGDAGGDLVGQLEQLRVRLTQRRGPAAYLVGQQQLAARRRPEPLDRLQGALVGDREAADLLDVVAPELHPQRVLLGRREDVDDAAADGELAALLDQVDAGVRRVRQPPHDVLQRRGVARDQLDRLQVAEPLDLRLEDRADRRDDDPERAVGASCRDGAAGAARPAGGRRCRCAGSAARAAASPSSGSRPTASGSSRSASAVGEVLGLAGGRGHRQHGAPGVRPARRRRTAAVAAGPVRSSAGSRPRRARRPSPRRASGRRGRRRPGRRGAQRSARGSARSGAFQQARTARSPPNQQVTGVTCPSLRTRRQRRTTRHVLDHPPRHSSVCTPPASSLHSI